MDHHALVVCHSQCASVANTFEQRLRCMIALSGLLERSERRADQQQNNCANRQSHKQFNQAETVLRHEKSLRGMV
ncbi:hypothetical protein J2Y90_000335 [Pseudomonas koreensis]|jgi:hypothetical protein|nr:hypothetical protein [Pseudomonas koreensis]